MSVARQPVVFICGCGCKRESLQPLDLDARRCFTHAAFYRRLHQEKRLTGVVAPELTPQELAELLEGV